VPVWEYMAARRIMTTCAVVLSALLQLAVGTWLWRCGLCCNAVVSPAPIFRLIGSQTQSRSAPTTPHTVGRTDSPSLADSVIVFLNKDVHPVMQPARVLMSQTPSPDVYHYQAGPAGTLRGCLRFWFTCHCQCLLIGMIW
jgi:hypothetical protein